MMDKLNKIRLVLFGVLLFACVGNLHPQQAMSLDGVIAQAAKDTEARLSAGSKLAVLNFTSTAEAFSDYVIEELSGALVMNRKVTIIERRSLDLIRKEMNLQLSGDVSDDSAQAIGKQLGAQAIVTGSLTNLGDTYRFRVKVINVETARIETQFSYNLGNNQQVAFLLSGSQNAPPDPSASPAVSGRPGTAATAPMNKVYKVGDTGPAGGLVFYDKGYISQGWQYLEAAARDCPTAHWGLRGVDVKGSREGIGTGKQNTAIIIQTDETGTAARQCREYSQGGYNDWFLPSRDELDLMYQNLKLKGLGSFLNTKYWSSSSYNSFSTTYALNQNFRNGEKDYDPSDNTFAVRAVRAF
jgi:TolB-like protein